MQHCAAFNANMLTAITNGDLSLVSDGYLSTDPSGKALLPVGAKLQQVLAFGTGMDLVRAIAPSLKQVGYPRIPRFDQTVVPADLPPFVNFGPYPPFIRANESFNFQANNTDAATQRQNVLAFLVDKEDPIPAGQSFVLYGTSLITTVAYGWVAGVVTWEDTYPTDLYSIVGIRIVGTNAMAGRLVMPYGGMRPGTIGTATERTDDFLTVWNGRFGSLGDFRPPTFPQVEIYASAAAATTYRVYLQVVRKSQQL